MTTWAILSLSTHAKAAMTYITHFKGNRKDWLEFYPVKDRLIAGADMNNDAIAMVDIGGGTGCQTIDFKKRFSELSGRYVVQDLVNMLPNDEPCIIDIEFMVHNFRKAQPIKGKPSISNEEHFSSPNNANSIV